MFSFLALIAAGAAVGLFVWLREKVERLEEEVKRLSAPSQTAAPTSSPAAALQPETVDFSSKVNGDAEQAAPPVAYPVPPVAFAPPPITPSKKSADEVAPPPLVGAAPAVGEGARNSSVDWEGFVGVKLFSWTAGIFLTLGAIFFLRYSIERGWLSPPIQMAIGLLAGIAILVVCELKAAQRYAVTATALAAAGLAILFATFYAAHARWDLLGLGTSFVALALVAALAVALAVRHDSGFIAGLGLLGGFATPALLGTAEDRPGALLSYLLLLDGGLIWAASKRKWPFLPFVSLPLTALFALSLATAPDDGSLWPILFAFLLLLDLGLLAFASLREQPALHLMAGLSTLAVLGAWFVRSATPALLGPGLAAAALFGVLYLVAPALAARLRPPGAIPDAAAHVGLLGSAPDPLRRVPAQSVGASGSARGRHARAPRRRGRVGRRAARARPPAGGVPRPRRARPSRSLGRGDARAGPGVRARRGGRGRALRRRGLGLEGGACVRARRGGRPVPGRGRGDLGLVRRGSPAPPRAPRGPRRVSRRAPRPRGGIRHAGPRRPRGPPGGGRGLRLGARRTAGPPSGGTSCSWAASSVSSSSRTRSSSDGARAARKSRTSRRSSRARSSFRSSARLSPRAATGTSWASCRSRSRWASRRSSRAS